VKSLPGLVVAALVGLLGLAGCSDDDPRPTPPPEFSEPVITSVPLRPSPTATTTITQACGGYPFDARKVRAFLPAGPAYAGAGPHPVEFLKQGELQASAGEDAQPVLPDDWERPAYEGVTQLVVCEHPDPSFRGRKVGECEYLGGDFNRGEPSELRSARYVYRVFEARTGRLVTQFTMRGTTGPQESCPARTLAPATLYYQAVRSRELVAKLRPLVTGPARPVT
jgi:hypothetical protein